MEPISMSVIGGMLAMKAGGDLLGAIAGHFGSSGDRKEAERLFKDAWSEIQSIGAGPDLSKEIIYEKFKSAGLLTPEVEKEIDVGVSKVAGIKEDPRLKSAQMDALEALKTRGAVGRTLTEKVARRQDIAQAERAAASQRAGILENLRSRGLTDSGAGLQAMLESADTLAQRQSEAADRASAMSDERALESLMKYGALGGQIRGQEFDIARTKAGAEDELNRFRVSAAMDREQRRAMYENQARQYNLQQQQQIMNMNTQMMNAEKLRQRQMQQQEWENELQRRGLRTGSLQQQGNFYQNRAAGTQGSYQAIGSGLGSMGSSLYGMGMFGGGSGAAGGGGAAGSRYSLGAAIPSPTAVGGGVPNSFGVDTTFGGAYNPLFNTIDYTKLGF